MAKPVEIMRKIMHRVAHRLGWFSGKVETWWEPDCCTGRLVVGFRCDECGELTGVHEAPPYIAKA